jgi:transketolase
MNISKLKEKAKDLRRKTFLSFIKKGEAHIGGSFSIIEILILIYKKILKKKDKFILSKSHSSFPLIILLREIGYKTKLTTHLELDKKNGIYCTTGSLGHGLPIATGMAFANKFKKNKSKTYVLISDGECQEGTTWESLLIGNKHNLKNLILIIDYNKIQALSKIDDALPLYNLKKKIKSFNWNCIEVKNGHSFLQLQKSFKNKFKNKKPTAIIANTIKGKGIIEFENNPIWHARKITGVEASIGKKRLGII